MSNEVWYRKWRPQRFAEVAGQEHVTRTLANAVAGGRIAHAYLFCGPRGTGKTSTARILAKAANCRQNEHGEPCNRCESCRGVSEGRALDLIEMDAASNRGIDEIRNLRDKIGYSPASSTYKVYLIDEVHELTQHAFDALLKTLEEPPAHVIFALATTEADRVPATIVSRCQRYDFRRIRLADVTGRLAEICQREQVEMPEGALELVARRATGSLRDAVNLLEQVVASSGNQPTLADAREALGLGSDERGLALMRHALAAELPECFETIAAARDEGVELRQLQQATLGWLRSLLLVKSGAETTLDLGEEAIAALREFATGVETASVLRLLRLLAAADVRADPVSSLPVELAVAEAILVPAFAPPAAAGAVPRRDAMSAQATARAVPDTDDHRAGAAPRGGAPLSPATRSPAVPRVPDVLRVDAVRPATPFTSQLQPTPPAPPLGAAADLTEPDELRPVVSVSLPSPATPAGVASSIESEPAMLEPVDATIAHSGADVAPPATLERLQDLMVGVYDRLREQRSKTAALINSGSNIIAEQGEQVTLALKHDFLATRIKSDDGGQLLRDFEDALESLAGRRYSVEVVVDPDVKGWRRPPATAQTNPLLDEAEKLGLRRTERQPAV